MFFFLGEKLFALCSDSDADANRALSVSHEAVTPLRYPSLSRDSFLTLVCS